MLDLILQSDVAGKNGLRLWKSCKHFTLAIRLCQQMAAAFFTEKPSSISEAIEVRKYMPATGIFKIDWKSRFTKNEAIMWGTIELDSSTFLHFRITEEWKQRTIYLSPVLSHSWNLKCIIKALSLTLSLNVLAFVVRVWDLIYSYFNQRCRKKIKKLISQHRKVTWVSDFGKNRFTEMQARKICPLAANLFFNLLANHSHSSNIKKHTYKSSFI